jgi:hypothetical protein
MKIPPAEIASIRERLDGAARELLDAWDDDGPDAPAAAEDPPELLYNAIEQLLDLLQVYENQGPEPGPCYEGEQIQPLSGHELSELGNYGLELLGRLSQLAHGQGLVAASAELELLAFPLGLWLARNDGEITSLEPVVNGLAKLANRSQDPTYLEQLCMQIAELVEAVSPSISEDLSRASLARPWRVLLLNWGIVATRSQRPALMRNAFDRLLEHLPDDASGFFREGMGQMDALDYPPHVREVIETYYETWSLKKTLH